MAVEQRPTRLGRGLSALLGDESEDNAVLEEVRGTRTLPVAELVPNPFQPRRNFEPEALEELSNSIREKGVLQPLIVRRANDGYQIIAGERRWRAAQRAGLHDVPVILKDLTDAEAMEIALIENVQRRDLNALEESAGYQALIDQFHYTQDQLSRIIGKSRSHIANSLRLLSLPESVQDMVRAQQLSAGHARTLVSVEDPEGLARQIVEGDLSVREAEALARGGKEKRSAAPRSPGGSLASAGGSGHKDADTIALEENLTAALGLRVSIQHRGESGGGDVRIEYKTLEQLDDICQRLSAVKAGDFE